LDFAQARYYANAQGRFTSVDPFNPIFETDESGFIDWIGEPQRWNRYSYSLNNPYKYVDRNGEDPLVVLRDGIRRIASLAAQLAQRNAGRITHPLVMAAEALEYALSSAFPSISVVTKGLQGEHEIAGARLAAAFEGKNFEGVANQNTPGIDGFLYPGRKLSTAMLAGQVEAVQLQSNGPSNNTLSNIVNDADAHEGKVNKGGQKNVHLFVTVTDPKVTASQILNRIQADDRAGFGIVKMTTKQYITKVTILTSDGAVRVHNGKTYSCDGNGNCTTR
jgi:RHS repeat-associated protein